MGIKKAILQTLAYYDIFDYPLTSSEIEKYLIGKKPFKEAYIAKVLSHISIVAFSQGFYFFVGREKIVAIRLEREKISKKKQSKIKKILKYITWIPTILFIGVSGSLAMDNASEDDDIDLFIITKENTLWTSRLIISCVLFVSGNLRRFDDRHVSDKVCVNMWMDRSHLVFAPARQNMYTAREIIQMRVLFNKSETGEKLREANTWITKFLPNTHDIPTYKKEIPFTSALYPIEFLAKLGQIWYMKKHMTRETITDGFAAFHPKDYTKDIVRAWKERCIQYGI